MGLVKGQPELPEPAGAARAQKCQEDYELEGRDELFGRRELPLLAGLFEALLGGLLGFSALVRHDASYAQHPVRGGPCVPADFAQDAREHRRHPTQQNQGGEHLGREGQAEQLQLRVDPSQERQ